MKSNVPTCPVLVVFELSLESFDNPKSQTFGDKSLESKIFPGFKSLNHFY